RQAPDRHRRLQREAAADAMAGISPLVLALEAERERLAHAALRRQDSLVEHRRTRHHGKRRLDRKLDEVVGCERIDQDLELESRLAEGLDADAGRALPRIADADDDAVAFAEKAALDADRQRLVPRPDVALHVVPQLEH